MLGIDLGSEYKTLQMQCLLLYGIYICTFLLTLMLIAFYTYGIGMRETLIESYHNGGLTTVLFI